MKSKHLLLAALALAAAGLSAAIWALSLPQPADPAPDLSNQAQVVYEAASLPLRMRVSNPQGGFTIKNLSKNLIEMKNAPAGYEVEGLEGLSLYSQALASAGDLMGKLTARRVVVEDAPDLSVFGLDSPSVTAAITLEDGSEIELLIGNDAPGEQGVYLALKGGRTVYLVTGSTLSTLAYTPKQFVQLTVTFTPSETPRFDRLVLTGANRTEPIELRYTAKADGSGHELWMLSPERMALPSGTQQRTADKVYGASASDIAAIDPTPAQLESFGLAEPFATARVESAKNPSFTLLVSAPDPQGRLYLMQEGERLVYQLYPDALPWLYFTMQDFWDPQLITRSIDDVQSISVESSGPSRTFTLSGEGDSLLVECDGQAIDTANFRRFYETLLYSRYEQWEELSPAGEASLRYTFVYRDSQRDVVEFFPLQPRVYALALNGKSHGSIGAAYLNALAEDLERIAAGQEVKPYR